MEPGRSDTKLTYADYELLPDDGLRHEIIDGEHYVTASPVTRHQRISRNLLYVFQSYLESHRIGEVFAAPFDVVLSFTDIVVPDLIYLSSARARLLTAKNLQGAPDLVVEILSHSTRRRDEQIKRDLYERVGVDEYWLLDPYPAVLTIYRRGTSGFEPPMTLAKHSMVSTPCLPGFEFQLDRVLA